MFDIDMIEEICKVSKEEKWPYPKTFEALKAAGVQSYKAYLTPSYHVVYEGDEQTWEEPVSDMHSFNVNPIFNKKGIQETLENHRTEKTPYVEFLKGIASAGVAYYIVDMVQRHVAYHGIEHHDQYIEKVPLFKIR